MHIAHRPREWRNAKAERGIYCIPDGMALNPCTTEAAVKSAEDVRAKRSLSPLVPKAFFLLSNH